MSFSSLYTMIIKSLQGVIVFLLACMSLQCSSTHDLTEKEEAANYTFGEKKYVKPAEEIEVLPLTKSQRRYFSTLSKQAYTALGKRINVNPNNHLLSPIGFHILSAMCEPLVDDQRYITALSGLSDVSPDSRQALQTLSASVIKSLPALDKTSDIFFVNMAVLFHEKEQDLSQIHFPDGYSEIIDKYYDGLLAEGPRTDDFITKLSEWARYYSSGKVLPPYFLSTVDCLSLMYFSAPWAEGFNPKDTQIRPFWAADKTCKELPTMHMEGYFDILQHEYYTAIKLPLGNHSKISVVVTIPHDDIAILTLLNELSENGMEDAFCTRRAQLFLPVIHIDSMAYLDDFCPTLSTVLAESSFFSQFLNDDASDYTLTQKLTIDWNEAGIQASSLSESGQPETSSEDSFPDQEEELFVDINRPFIFTVQVEGLDIALFCGYYGGEET